MLHVIAIGLISVKPWVWMWWCTFAPSWSCEIFIGARFWGDLPLSLWNRSSCVSGSIWSINWDPWGDILGDPLGSMRFSHCACFFTGSVTVHMALDALDALDAFIELWAQVTRVHRSGRVCIWVRQVTLVTLTLVTLFLSIILRIFRLLGVTLIAGSLLEPPTLRPLRSRSLHASDGRHDRRTPTAPVPRPRAVPLGPFGALPIRRRAGPGHAGTQLIHQLGGTGGSRQGGGFGRRRSWSHTEVISQFSNLSMELRKDTLHEPRLKPKTAAVETFRKKKKKKKCSDTNQA